MHRQQLFIAWYSSGVQSEADSVQFALWNPSSNFNSRLSGIHSWDLMLLCSSKWKREPLGSEKWIPFNVILQNPLTLPRLKQPFISFLTNGLTFCSLFTFHRFLKRCLYLHIISYAILYFIHFVYFLNVPAATHLPPSTINYNFQDTKKGKKNPWWLVIQWTSSIISSESWVTCC